MMISIAEGDCDIEFIHGVYWAKGIDMWHGPPIDCNRSRNIIHECNRFITSYDRLFKEIGISMGQVMYTPRYITHPKEMVTHIQLSSIRINIMYLIDFGVVRSEFKERRLTYLEARNLYLFIKSILTMHTHLLDSYDREYKKMVVVNFDIRHWSYLADDSVRLDHGSGVHERKFIYFNVYARCWNEIRHKIEEIHIGHIHMDEVYQQFRMAEYFLITESRVNDKRYNIGYDDRNIAVASTLLHTVKILGYFVRREYE